MAWASSLGVLPPRFSYIFVYMGVRIHRGHLFSPLASASGLAVCFLGVNRNRGKVVLARSAREQKKLAQRAADRRGLDTLRVRTYHNDELR